MLTVLGIALSISAYLMVQDIASIAAFFDRVIK